MPDLFSSLSPPRTTTRRCLFPLIPLPSTTSSQSLFTSEREGLWSPIRSPVRWKKISRCVCCVSSHRLHVRQCEEEVNQVDRSFMFVNSIAWNIRDDGRRRRKRKRNEDSKFTEIPGRGRGNPPRLTMIRLASLPSPSHSSNSR